MFERTPYFEAYVEPARRYPAIWRLLVGFATGLAIYFGSTILIFTLLGFFLSAIQVTDLTLNMESGSEPFTMFVLLFSFFGMVFGALGAALWHKRGLRSLTGPFRAFGKFFLDTLIIAVPVFVISGVLVGLFADSELTSQMPLSTWAFYVLLALPLLFVQVFAEELIFRGYLTQQLAARFSSFAVWGILPSAIFGLAHYSAEFDPIVAGLFIFATGYFAFVATDLTRLTGNLGAATAFHFTNNFFALFLVAIPGQLSGLALYLTPFTIDDISVIIPLVMVDLVVITVIWQALRRRYA